MTNKDKQVKAYIKKHGVTKCPTLPASGYVGQATTDIPEPFIWMNQMDTDLFTVAELLAA